MPQHGSYTSCCHEAASHPAAALSHAPIFCCPAGQKLDNDPEADLLTSSLHFLALVHLRQSPRCWSPVLDTHSLPHTYLHHVGSKRTTGNPDLPVISQSPARLSMHAQPLFRHLRRHLSISYLCVFVKRLLAVLPRLPLTTAPRSQLASTLPRVPPPTPTLTDMALPSDLIPTRFPNGPPNFVTRTASSAHDLASMVSNRIIPAASDTVNRIISGFVGNRAWIRRKTSISMYAHAVVSLLACLDLRCCGQAIGSLAQLKSSFGIKHASLHPTSGDHDPGGKHVTDP